MNEKGTLLGDVRRRHSRVLNQIGQAATEAERRIGPSDNEDSARAKHKGLWTNSIKTERKSFCGNLLVRETVKTLNGEESKEIDDFFR
jgi:hypothetical protein